MNVNNLLMAFLHIRNKLHLCSPKRLLVRKMRSWQPPPPHFTSEYYLARISEFAKQLDSHQRPDLLLLGDSMIEKGDWARLLSPATIFNMGISGDCAAGVLNRVDLVVSAHPRAVLVSIGTNDVCWGYSDEEFLGPLRVILFRLRESLPYAQLMLNTIPPVNETAFKIMKRKGHVVNEKVVEWNNEIYNLTKSLEWSLVDLYSKAESEGELKSSLTTDGIHLNADGYELWANLILETLRDQTK